MDYIAESKNIKISPRKVRLVADMVKKFPIPAAISQLLVTNKRAAGPLKKTLDSAIANAVNNFKAKKEDLVIKEIVVNEGIVYKRFHFAGRGRTRPYKRKASHIRIVLETREIAKPETIVKEESKTREEDKK